MKSKNHILWIAVFMQFGLFLLVGCQADLDQGTEVTQEPATVIEEVTYDSGEEDLIIETELGKVAVDEETNSGHLIETEDTQEAEKSLEQPKSPEDMPGLEGATNFNWAGADGSGMLSFKIKNVGFEDACNRQSQLLEGAGWTLDEGVNATFSGTSTTTLKKEGFIISVTCAEQVGEKDEVVVTMVKGPQ